MLLENTSQTEALVWGICDSKLQLLYCLCVTGEMGKMEGHISNWLRISNRAKNANEVAVFEYKEELEQGRGFLVYLSQTYTSIIPYLKGIHLDLDGWRGGKDQDG